MTGIQEFFEVEYTYYQYNSGAADNGTRTKIHRCSSDEEAHDLAARIEADAVAHREGRSDDVDEELRNDLIPWDGYFISASAWRCRREPLVMVSAPRR